MRPIVKKLRLGLLLVLLLVITGHGMTWLLYPGFYRAGWYQFLDGGPRESYNLFLCLKYWSEYLGQLAYDAESGMYEFPPDEPGADARTRGIAAYHRGNYEDAVRLLKEDLEKRGADESRMFWLAMAHLRHAEAQNCLAMMEPLPADDPSADGHHHWTHTQGLCTLPIGVTHQNPESARAAIDLFSRLLDRYGPNPLYSWLLNFGYMTVGGYPDEVPEDRRLDNAFTQTFYGKQPDGVPVFTDQAARLGVATQDAGKGVAVEDYNGDGSLDIVTGGSFDSLRLYLNMDGRGFRDATSNAGLDGFRQPHFITNTDYNNDGLVDLYVGSLFHHDRLYRNLGNGRFDDVTEAAGLAVPEGRETMTWCSAWGDIDNDGDLDLFVARWGMKAPLVSGYLARRRQDAQLFVNEGGVFQDATEAWGLASFVDDNAFIGAAFGDVDNDGRTDLFVSGINKRNSRLFRNDPDKGFVAVETHPPGFVCAFLDIDHDGRLDLFHGGLADARTTTAKTVLGQSFGFERTGYSVLLHNRQSLTPIPGFFNMPVGVMGANYGDLDNDGCYDFYLGTGGPESWFILPNLMYQSRNRGGQCLPEARNITAANHFGTIQKGHGIVFFDFDEDGDQDIYSSLGGMWPGDRWPNQLFVNEGTDGGRWVKIRLVGTRTNRHGIGARIRVEAEDEAGRAVVRQVHMDGKTGFGSAPFLAHIGLGDAVTVKEIVVNWPVSGAVNTYAGTLDALHILVENDPAGSVIHE
ncbi:MAG: CRTAC1 family protein [Acidobacteriota bacterium]|nr:CRTAC1 family protein [Acidobacteriota bacterium]